MIARLLFSLIITLVAAGQTAAQDTRAGWSALASDRAATDVGDSLTVIIVESSSAATSSQSGSRRDTRLSGSLNAGDRVSESGGLGVQGAFSGQGQINRSGRLIGQVGVTITEVLPNGDFKISGAQTLNIDGEATLIRLAGRIRPADISGDNTVLSSRVTDAAITYEGDGALSRGGRPGLLARVLSWFGL